MEDADVIINGQPTHYDTDRIYKGICCDCGLVHLELYSIEKGKVVLTVYRDDHMTTEVRRVMPKRERRKIVEMLGGTLE